MTALPAPLEQLLLQWLPAQRWFGGKGLQLRLIDLGLGLLPGPAGVRIEHRLVGVDTGDRVQVAQVPLVFRTTPLPDTSAGGRGLIGRLGDAWVYDGPHDPAFVAALLTLFGGSARGTVGLDGHEAAGFHHDPLSAARVLAGEQSNTSLIVDEEGGRPLMIKLFRVVTGGPNPDVEVTSALSDAGVSAVARVAGWIDGTWTDASGEATAGHLAVSTEFVGDGRDAWRDAVDAVRTNTDYTTQATQLGVAVAEVHHSLADRLGSAPATTLQVDGLIAQLRGRVEWALREVRQLQPLAGRLAVHADSLSRLTPADVGPVQRVHGDLHLGQVLYSPSRGWILLDFEGEPLRPLAERIRPDVPVRDLVGMIRSFDYAAGFVDVEEPDLTYLTAAWVRHCTEAFLAGYGATRQDPAALPGHPVFDALLIDKALYEAVYEARNRPDWVGIPLTALNRVLDH